MSNSDAPGWPSPICSGGDLEIHTKRLRIERRMQDRTITLVCPECGKQVQAPEDVDLRLTFLSYLEGTGGAPEVDPQPEEVLSHPHKDALSSAAFAKLEWNASTGEAQ